MLYGDYGDQQKTVCPQHNKDDNLSFPKDNSLILCHSSASGKLNLPLTRNEDKDDAAPHNMYRVSSAPSLQTPFMFAKSLLLTETALSESSTNEKSISGQSALFERQLLSTCTDHSRHINKPSTGRTKLQGVIRGIIRGDTGTINPQGKFYLWWSGFLFIAYLYNLFGIPLRASFTHVQGIKYTQAGCLIGPPDIVCLWRLLIWMCLDVFFDVVFLLDIVLVQSRINSNRKNENENDDNNLGNCQLFIKSVTNYIFHWHFWFDSVSSLPFELFYSIPFLRFNPLLRLPRLLKIRHFRFFLNQFENSTNHPHVFRLVKTYGYLIYLIHIFTCIYYGVSERQGFGSTNWVYDGKGISYIRCFYLAFLLVSTIHGQETRLPSNIEEYIIEIVGSIIGILFMAMIINNISRVIIAANYHKLAMQRKRDQLKQFLQIQQIPIQLVKRVELWYNYAFTENNILNEKEILSLLPKNMRSDLLIHNILETLSKVRIFQGFDMCLLRELVLQFKPVLFIPGDYICRKGDIGKEMYIVSQGTVMVVEETDNKKMHLLAELGPGSIFGEISLLAIDGGNRRTTTIISKGFTDLFILSKKDMYNTLSEYPNAQEQLKQRAKQILRKDIKRQNTLDKIHSNRAIFDTKDKTRIKQETSLLIGDHDGIYTGTRPS